MKRLQLSILFILFVFVQQSFGQEYDLLVDPVLINLKGRLVDAIDGEPVPYASVINPRTHRGALTNDNGYFTMEVLNIDSLLISVIGYTKEYMRIPLNHSEDSVLVLNARPIVYPLAEVEITGESPVVNLDGISTGKPVDISPELRGDAFNSKPNVLDAIFSPLSFLQYHLSRSEREKRQVRELMVSQEEWAKISGTYNKDVVMALTGLNFQEADTFMIYFNQKNLLSGRSSEYDIREAILTQYRNFLVDQKDTVNVE